MNECMAVCGRCYDVAVPFVGRDIRDDWLTAHNAATGHDARAVDGWMPTGAAVLTAYPERKRS